MFCPLGFCLARKKPRVVRVLSVEIRGISVVFPVFVALVLVMAVGVPKARFSVGFAVYSTYECFVRWVPLDSAGCPLHFPF